MFLVSKKEQPSPIYSSLARQFGKKFDFAFVSVAQKSSKKNLEKDTSQLLQALGVEEKNVPVLVIRNFVIPNARDEKLTDLKPEKMTEFLSAYSLAMAQLDRKRKKM